MRSQLDAEMHSTSRREGAIRRYGIPVAAAAAVLAAAIGGYAVLDGRGGFGPAGTTTGSPEPTQQTSRPVPNPANAYRLCAKLVPEADAWNGRPSKKPVGKLAIDNGKGITVVMANDTYAYTCNVKPDSAVSRPRPLGSRVSPEAFDVALNATRNVLPFDSGEMIWGGGALPDGVTSVTYVFPDGHEEPAVIRDGFWAMQYFTEEGLDGTDDANPIKVELDGPGGPRELSLEWGTHTCNQVSHGC